MPPKLVSLKSKLLVALTLVMIASIVISSYFAFTSAKPKDDSPSQKLYDSFELIDATGTAYIGDEIVDVSISIIGDANGKVKTVFHLHARGGYATIGDFDAISVTKGQGIIVNNNEFIHLNLMMSAQYYGGRSTVWILRGTTEALTGNTTPVSLQAPRVVLPLEGYPQLTDLTLSGAITFE